MVSKRVGKLIGLISLIGVALGTYQLAYWDKIYPGVTIAQIPIANKNQKQAETILTRVIQQKKTFSVFLVWESQSWELNLDDFQLTYQPEKTVTRALALGRNQNLVKNWLSRYRLWRQGQNLDLDYLLNQDLLNEKVATISAAVFVPAIPPSISLTPKLDTKQKSLITVDLGKEGRQLEEEKLLKIINFQLSNLVDLPIDLPVKKTKVAINQSVIEKTKKRAENLLNKKLILGTQKESWSLTQEELINWLAFNQDYQDEKIKDYVAQLATLINQGPQDALFRFESGRVVAFKPSKSGRQLQENESVQLIKEALDQLEKSGENEKSIDLPVQSIEPKVKIGDINRFGIVKKIGEGHSSLHGSIASRINNIQLAANKLSGILIPPGGEFSFNQSLGEVSQTTGFQQAYIIKEGRTILGDGGGVCQVSTTLFRAALRAGLPILERHPHAYRVSYYEQNYQPGFDATVFAPNIDLRFKNDTPTYLLLQTKFDKQAGNLTFEIYGADDNRLVSISEARIWDQVPPPPDLYQDDPTLPMGTVKQIDWKAWGAKIAFDWKVTKNGQVLQERTFYSTYRPWQAIYLRGTAP